MAWLQDPTAATMPWHKQPELQYFDNWVHGMIARSHRCHHAMKLTTQTALFRQLSSWHDCKIPLLPPCHDTNNLNYIISTIEFMAWLQDPTSATMPWHQQIKLHFVDNWVHGMIARSHHCHHAMKLTTQTALFRQLSSWHDCKIPLLPPCHDTNNLNCIISTIEFMAWLQDPTTATMPWH